MRFYQRTVKDTDGRERPMWRTRWSAPKPSGSSRWPCRRCCSSSIRSALVRRARRCRKSPKVSLSRLFGSLKGVCARRLRQEFPGHNHKYLWGDRFWSPSYFAASCGGAPLSIIKEYIENQKRPGTALHGDEGAGHNASTLIDS
ncbi:IS200/IS605 family transposase [Streptomyces aureus]|uniref:IS200/IS605 family transposase n=2 Tax=Streptomyces aureus TaxID=193461 RepID=UPI003370C1F2